MSDNKFNASVYVGLPKAIILCSEHVRTQSQTQLILKVRALTGQRFITAVWTRLSMHSYIQILRYTQIHVNIYISKVFAVAMVTNEFVYQVTSANAKRQSHYLVVKTGLKKWRECSFKNICCFYSTYHGILMDFCW